MTAWIPVDFSRAASVSHTLRTGNGEPVPFDIAENLSGQLGPAGNDPLSKHLWGRRTFETGGMGFTHPLPPGSYIFSSAVTFTNGEVHNEDVEFEVR